MLLLGSSKQHLRSDLEGIKQSSAAPVFCKAVHIVFVTSTLHPLQTRRTDCGDHRAKRQVIPAITVIGSLARRSAGWSRR